MVTPVDVLIDRAGKVRAYSPGEAARARVSRWRAIGRDFVRDLGWTVGAEAAARIDAFRVRGPARDRFVAGRLAIELCRVADGVAVTVQYARETDSAQDRATIGSRSSGPGTIAIEPPSWMT